MKLKAEDEAKQNENTQKAQPSNIMTKLSSWEPRRIIRVKNVEILDGNQIVPGELWVDRTSGKIIPPVPGFNEMEKTANESWKLNVIDG